MPDMRGFLTRFFEQRHFNRMPPAVRARFNHYLRDNNLVGNMTNWRNNLMHRVGDHYEQRDLPDVAYMDPASDWDKLYFVLQNILSQLHDDTDSMRNQRVADFVNRYFIIENIFDGNTVRYTANADAERECGRLHALLAANSDARDAVAYYLEGTNININEFITGLNNHEYNNNQKFQDTLISVLRSISHDGAAAPLFSGHVDMGRILYNGFSDPRRIDPARMARLHATYRELLSAIHDTPAIAEAVKAKDTKKEISDPLETALKNVNYEDEKSPNHVPAEFQDQKNIFERVRDGVKTFADDKLDSWGRILTLRGTRRFFSKGAKDIVDAIKKAKTKDGKPIKPTDGLKGILAAKDDIAKALAKSPQGREHFKWFTECMTAIQAETKDAFNGALKNPKQMRDVVSQVIYRAIQDGKPEVIDAAKSTMEVLSTMKYSLMDSATIDALRDGLKDTKWLSDKGLSWNKYEGVRFVTSAFDKAAKYAMLTVGRGVAAIRNVHNLTHLKFRGNDERFREMHQAHQAFLTNREARRTATDANSTRILGELAASHGTSGRVIDDTTIAAERARLTRMDAILGRYTPGSRTYARLQTARDNLSRDIQSYDFATNAIASLATWNEDNPDRYNELMAFWDTLETHWISHRFTFSAKALQDRFQGTPRGATQTRAETVWQNALARYRQRYGT